MNSPLGGYNDPNNAPNGGFGEAGNGGYSYYPPNMGYAGDPSQKPNGVALAALIVGILAVLGTLSLVAAGLGVPLAVVGVILAIVALVRAKNFPPPLARRGMAIAGLILSAISLLLVIVFAIGIFIFLADSGLMECVNLQSEEAINQCVTEVFEQ